MKSIKIMLMGIALILTGMAFGLTGVDEFEAVMIILVPAGFIMTLIGLFKKDRPQ